LQKQKGRLIKEVSSRRLNLNHKTENKIGYFNQAVKFKIVKGCETLK
jgi:hypothetical protein